MEMERTARIARHVIAMTLASIPIGEDGVWLDVVRRSVCHSWG